MRPISHVVLTALLLGTAACGDSEVDPVDVFGGGDDTPSDPTGEEGPGDVAEGFTFDEQGRLVRPAVGVVTVTGAIDETITESTDGIFFRDVGGCLQGEFGVGTFIDEGGDGFDFSQATTLYTLTAEAEDGVVDASTRGPVPVEVELTRLNDIMDSEDDQRFEGAGTLEIMSMEILDVADDWVAPNTELRLAGELSSSDGETVTVEWSDAIGFVCN